MAYYSRAAYTGDGIATDYTVTFPYLDQSHVKIYLDGVITTAWSWVNSTTIRFTSAPALNAEIMLLRRSSPSVRLVDYTGGAAFDEATLDQDSTQAFYLFQEAIDQANTGFSYDPFGDNFAAVLTGTSVTSLAIGTGTKNLVTQNGKNWSVGQRLRIADDNGNNLMEGEVTSYAGTSLQVNVDYTEGGGTLGDWNISVAGARGLPGSSGAAVTGPQGVAGVDGHTILSGTVAPSNTDGNNGDIYIKTNTSTFYGPKAGGVWPAGVSLIGATGSIGPSGTNGATWYSGAGAPGGTGVDGDFYFRTSNDDVYQKAGGVWSVITNIKGSTGATGAGGSAGAAGTDGVSPGFRLTFDTTTADADPGQGKVRANNGTFASITKLFIDNLDANATDITTWLDSLDDSSNTVRGAIRLQKTTDPTIFMEFNVTGSVVDGTGYRKVNVTPISGAIPANGTALAATYHRAGDVGATGAGSGNVNSTGTIVSGHIVKYNDATGNVISDGGVLGALANKNTVATADIDNNAVDDTKLRQGAGNTVIGRSANSAGNNADMQATVDGQVLRLSGTTLGFGTIATAGIANDAVDNTKAANMAQSTIKGRAVGAGTGDPTDLTTAQATAIMDTVVGDSGSGGTKGVVPAPGAGTAAKGFFLAADATFKAPPVIVPGGRLTLATATPVMTTTQSAKTTVYYTPVDHQYVPLYDGTSINSVDFGGETSQATTDTAKSPAACVPYTCYDIFGWDDAGTKRTTRGPKWSKTATITVTIAAPGVVTWTGHGLLDGMTVSFTNSGGALPTGITAGTDYFITKVDANSFKLSTTLANQVAGTFVTTTGTQSGTHTGENRTQSRGTGAGTSELVQVKGVWLNANSITNGAAAQRGTYLGTVVTNGSSQVDWIYGGSAAGGTAAFFGVFNAYNQFPVATYIQNSTSAYTYATAAWRAANASAGMRCTFVRGLDVGEVRAVHSTVVTAGTAVKASGIGVDSITAPSGTVVPVSGSQPGDAGEVQHYFGTTLGIGQHYLSVIEWGGASCQFNVITSPTSNGLLVSVGL